MIQNFKKEYKNLQSNFLYYDKAKIKRIFLIFEGKGGSQIITDEIIPDNTKVQDFLILNSEIERGLKYVETELRTLIRESQPISSYLFYFSQYGGSKTQFLNLVQDVINEKLSEVITIFIDDLTQLKPSYIFEELISQLMHNLGLIREFNDKKSYNHFFEEIYPIISDINIAMRQSANLKKAEKLIEGLDTKNPERKEKLSKLNDLLHSTILIDKVDILKKIKKLMQKCAEKNLVFLFLFDEVDLWIDEDSSELRFSKRLTKISKVMKNLLELPDHNIKLFFLFACTDRVNRLFQEQQTPFSIRSPTATRLIRIYNSSERISESGTYGDSIDQALLKLGVLNDVINDDGFNIDETFFSKAVIPLKKKFNDIPRRNTNSIIIRLLKCYRALYPPLQNGLKNWKNNTQKYGNLIQDHITSILKRLHITFHREDILIDPERMKSTDKIDGYFLNYDYKGLEKKTFSELKLTKEFKEKKARQVLQWLQIHPEEPFILIILSPDNIDDIKEKINFYAENNDYKLELLKSLHIIHINDPYAFCAINGITDVISNPKNLASFLDNFSFWFDFFGDFTEQYLEIQNKIGFIRYPPAQERKTEEEIEIGAEKEKVSEVQLTKEQHSCIQLLTHMQRENSFTKSGRKNKSSIEQIVEEKSMGITNLERLYKTMKEATLISKITENQVTFSIKERDKLLDLGLEDFMEELKKKFISKPKNILSHY